MDATFDSRDQRWYRLAIKHQESGMSNEQRRVLKRRKAHLADMVEVSADLIQEFFLSELIDDTLVKELKEDKCTASQHMIKLIDVAMTCSSHDAFAKLLNILSKRSPQLINEIVTEIRYEEGAGGVPKAVADEAGVLVHKKFGSSKRFGIGDKQDIIDLVAVKMQLLNEDWQSKMKTTEVQLTISKQELEERDKIASEVLLNYSDFVSAHYQQFTTHAHDMRSTSEALALNNSGKQLLPQVKEVTDKFLQRVAGILEHRDKLLADRSRTLQNLHVSDDSNSLDWLVQESIRKLQKEIKELKEEVAQTKAIDTAPSTNGLNPNAKIKTQQSDQTKRLNKKVTELENCVQDRDDLIEKLQDELARKNQEIDKLTDELAKNTKTLSMDDVTKIGGATNKNRMITKKIVKSASSAGARH